MNHEILKVQLFKCLSRWLSSCKWCTGWCLQWSLSCPSDFHRDFHSFSFIFTRIFIDIHGFTPIYILLHGNSRKVPMIHGEVGSWLDLWQKRTFKKGTFRSDACFVMFDLIGPRWCRARWRVAQTPSTSPTAPQPAEDPWPSATSILSWTLERETRGSR